MSAWNDLSRDERSAIRKLALGYDQVSARMLRRLAKLGLVDEGPEGRLTAAGIELYRANPPIRKRRQGQAIFEPCFLTQPRPVAGFAARRVART